jgi:hypothetical protein
VARDDPEVVAVRIAEGGHRGHAFGVRDLRIRIDAAGTQRRVESVGVVGLEADAGLDARALSLA